MPALCAAIGSFHVKSPMTYLVRVLITVRVLPLFLTVDLICSVTCSCRLWAFARTATRGTGRYKRPSCGTHRYLRSLRRASRHPAPDQLDLLPRAALVVPWAAISGEGRAKRLCCPRRRFRLSRPPPCQRFAQDQARLMSWFARPAWRAAVLEGGRTRRRFRSPYRQRCFHPRLVRLIEMRRRARRGRSEILPD